MDTERRDNAPLNGTPLTHEDAKSRELAEAYVAGRLEAAATAAFEEHFFACAECWEEVQELDRFRAGVRDAAQAGRLDEAPAAGAAPYLTWMFAAAAAALLAFASWTALVQVPRLERELAEARSAPPPKPERVEVPVVVAQANLPVVMLEASRAGEPAAVKVPDGTREVALWMDGVAGPGSFRFVLADARGGEVAVLGGLTVNPHGALTATVPATKLPRGVYTARLFGGNGRLAAEYKFDVT